MRVLAYLDDVYILTTPDKAREAHDVAKEVLKRVCGISVNQGKLQAWCHAARAAPPDLAELNLPPRPDGSLPPPVWKADLPPDQAGLKVLDSPIGSEEYVAAKGRELLEVLGLAPSAKNARKVLEVGGIWKPHFTLRSRAGARRP